jgi:hypothetical protein
VIRPRRIAGDVEDDAVADFQPSDSANFCSTDSSGVAGVRAPERAGDDAVVVAQRIAEGEVELAFGAALHAGIVG